MALVKGSTYDNVFYDFVLDGTRDLLVSEFSNAMIYIAPEIKHKGNFQIRIWGSGATTRDWGASAWQKEYNVGIFLYMMGKNPADSFYQQFYGDSERLYQILNNNMTLTKTVGSISYTWINGKVDEIDINNFQGDEEDIDGLNVASLSFSCFVDRAN